MAHFTTSDNNYGVAKWIVDAQAGQGTHTTIQAAITAASSGDTIFIRAGTYTEDITLKAGVNLTAFSTDSSENGTGHVQITGKATFTGVGSVSIAGIQLNTNSDFFLAITGSSASVINLYDCYLNCSNNTGISYTSSSASSGLNIYSCYGNLGTTGIAYYSMSGAGTLLFKSCYLNNSGGSSTANTSSAGIVLYDDTEFSNPTTTSGTNIFAAFASAINTEAQNATSFTSGGSGNSTVNACFIVSGTASAISISNVANITNSTISSSNTNAITGAGSIQYADISFANSSNINVTTQAVLYEGPSKKIGSTNSGNTNTLTLTNDSNTASSAANFVANVAGSTAANPTYQSIISGVTNWTWGADNAVSSPGTDPWKLASSTALGTSDVIIAYKSGVINYPKQVAFLEVLGTDDTNATGNGAIYTLGGGNALTEIFDQSSSCTTAGVFTAPVTGIYHIGSNLVYSSLTALMTFNVLNLVTSNRTYSTGYINIGVVRTVAAAPDFGYAELHVLADMDAGDTFTVNAQISGGAGNTVTIDATAARVFMYGYLAC